MSFRFILLAIVLLLAGCGDEYYGTPPDNGNGHGNGGGYSFTEIGPVLSPNRDYIYFVGADTADSQKDGIYRVSLSNGKRELEIAGKGLYSPSLNFDHKTIAYLDSGKIYYYNLDSSKADSSLTGERFESILYIHDNILLAYRSYPGNRGDSIYIIDNDNSIDPILCGWHPTFVAKDTFVYFDSPNDTVFYIKLNNVLFYGQPQILFTFISPGLRPYWPSYDSKSGRLAFCLTGGGYRKIYTAEKNGILFEAVGQSYYTKSVIVSADSIISTGLTGQLQISNFSGTRTIPFNPR